MPCSTCFEITLQSCPATIELIGGLDPSTEYFWVIRTKTGKVYQRKATTNGSGKLSIDTSMLPDGMLNPYAGSFQLEIREGGNYLNIVPLSLNDENYTCVLLSFAELEGDEGINTSIYALPAVSTGTLANFTDFTFNQVTGEMEFTGATPDSNLIQTDFLKYPLDGTSYINGEDTGFSIGPFAGESAFAEYFTPGSVLVKWRRISPGPSFAPLSAWKEKVLTTTRLQRRWYRLWRIIGSTFGEIYPGFAPLDVYNVEGDVIGVANDITELIDLWNGDPANANFSIIANRTLNTWYEVQLDPDAAELLYPVKYVHVEPH